MTGLWPDAVVDAEGVLIPTSSFARANEGPQPMVEYQMNPLGFIVEQLGIPRHTLVWSENQGYDRHVWDGTPDPLVAMLDGLAAWQDVGVEAGTGTQKSHTAACIILWFLASWRGARVFTYAPKEDQLRLYMWAEVGKLWPRFQRLYHGAELTDLRIRMVPGRDDWIAQGFPVGIRAGEDSSTRAQGVHGRDVLLITEETPGMEAAVMVALRNTRTGAHNLQLSLGNPDNNADTLHQFCVLDGVKHVRISALDHPNVVTGDPEVVPGAASPAGIRRIEAADEPGSPMYERRVRGVSPTEATDALIKLEWCQNAARRYAAMLAIKGVPRAMGVDVANSEKGDKAAIAFYHGACLERVVSRPCPNANQLGRDAIALAKSYGVASSWHVGVDPVGVGAGTVNEMNDAAFPPSQLWGGPVDAASRAGDGGRMDWVPDANRFDTLRSQMAWQLREDLRLGRLGLPNDPELFRQLTMITWEPVNGKVVLEAKKKLKGRTKGGKSPDEFDAIMYGNWVRPRFAEPGATGEVSDDRHPGFDYKRRERKLRRRPVNEDGTVAELIEDDVRERPFHVPLSGWQPPRYFARDDDDDDLTDEDEP